MLDRSGRGLSVEGAEWLAGEHGRSGAGGRVVWRTPAAILDTYYLRPSGRASLRDPHLRTIMPGTVRGTGPLRPTGAPMNA